MTSLARIEPGDRVVITGASGFIGSAVARAVQGRGARIVAVVEPGTDDRNLQHIEAERAVADIRDAAAVRDACAGARFVFHLAAIYRFWARDLRIFYDVNVGGTLNVLNAARAAGCQRRAQRGAGAVPVGGPRLCRVPHRGQLPRPDGGCWVNVRSKARGLLALFVFTDLGPDGAPTRLVWGSTWLSRTSSPATARTV